MKLYLVHLWCMDNRLRDQLILVAAESENQAETQALYSSYFECAEAEEVNEIDGYKVIFEKVS